MSRRGRAVANRAPHVVPHGPVHLLIDSTGLKLFGNGEWDGEKHGRARRSWRKLHLAVDAETGEIVASVLTCKEAADAGQVPALLEQIEGEIASVTADGAYDRHWCMDIPKVQGNQAVNVFGPFGKPPVFSMT